MNFIPSLSSWTPRLLPTVAVAEYIFSTINTKQIKYKNYII